MHRVDLRFFFICGILLLGIHHSQAQHSQLSIQADVGVGAGWWYYLHPYSEALGERMDRSHLDTEIPAALRLRWQYKRLALGLSYQLRSLRDDELVAHDDRVGNRSRIPIAEQGGSVERHHIGLNLGYTLVQVPKYQLRAELELGTFSLNSLHPDQENFGARLYRQYHLTQAFRVSKRFYLIAQMQFARSHVWMIEPAFRGEQHQFASVGFNAGFEWVLFSPNNQ